MSCVQQGTIPFEVLVTELPDLPLPELEILLKAARTGKLSTRDRSMAVMSYMRGIASAQICSFVSVVSNGLPLMGCGIVACLKTVALAPRSTKFGSSRARIPGDKDCSASGWRAIPQHY